MTPDEAEASACRYVAPHILHLSSGRWAVYDRRRTLQGIFNTPNGAIPLLMELSKPPAKEERRPKTRDATLSLEDLGL